MFLKLDESCPVYSIIIIIVFINFNKNNNNKPSVFIQF